MTKLQNAHLYLLDMDGTLYLGNDEIAGAREFVRTLKRTGRHYVYLTNNSSRAQGDYVNRMRGLGFPCEPENVYTSGMAAARRLLSDYPDKSVYVVGTRALVSEIEESGVTIDVESPDVLLVGFDCELYYEKLNRACRFLRNGAKFLATNPDLVCPMPGGESMPDCASICALLTTATGKTPEYIGKPNRDMVDIICERYGVPISETVVVGDRLYTDIACAVNAGAVSVLVLSGETTREMLEASPINPDYVLDSVAEITAVICS